MCRFMFYLSAISAIMFCSCDMLRTKVPGEEKLAQAEAEQAEKKAEQAEKGDGKGIIGKTTAEVVDVYKARDENPDLAELQRNTLGDNPLTQSTNAYVYIRSEVSTLGMQQSIKVHKALNDKWPTYEEFMDIMQQNNIKFTALKPWQKYGYDSESGEIVILQDEAEKKRRYKAQGLDYEPGKI